MHALIIGGAGFVGLNIAARLVQAGYRVTVLDRRAPPDAARAALGEAAHEIAFVIGDVTQPDTVADALSSKTDLVVYGAAITADAARDAREPERVLAVNLAALVPALRAARDAKVRRVILLSSGAALGRAADGGSDPIEETLPPDPASLYGITKFAGERVAARLADLWSLDVIAVRLSAVFGPFEYATGLRDTFSPLGQIMIAAVIGKPALLARPGFRDWVFATDVADAVLRLAQAVQTKHRLYNITSEERFAALAWGEALAARRAGFACRLVREGETPTIDLHGTGDRPNLSPARLRDEFGWRARFGLAESVAHLEAWSRDWGANLWDAV